MEEDKYKVCFKCGISKPLSEFYKHSQMADGHLGKCKECAKKDVTDNRNLREDFYKAYDRVRSYSEKRKEQRRKYQARKDVKERHKTALRKWSVNNQHKRKAQIAVGNAIRDGRLFKQPCFICGATDNIEAHHCNYDAPLDVIWLCTKHHGEVHREYDELNDKGLLENTVRGSVWDGQVRGVSRYRGVGIHKTSGKFIVHICVNSKNKYLGLFTDELEAATAYDNRCEELYGDRPNGTRRYEESVQYGD